ncbi:MAG: hypothetical protein HUU29_01820 [Planctomycetaceae bacterium]|nr:hypothetical protein [Planctomycetaceae bacterium]
MIGIVIPAQAGIQIQREDWMPAYAGMTAEHRICTQGLHNSRESGMHFNPRPARNRRFILPLILLHAVQAAVVGLAASGLSFAGVVLLRQGTTAEGVLYLVLVAALLAFEVGLALYLILRKRKIARLIAEARLAINAADTARARFALHSLAGFLEYRMDASSITYGLGVAALLDGDSGEALRLLREAGANAAAVELRALIHLSQGMTERATRLTKAGLTLSPGEPRLWVMLAACHQAARREDDARTLIDKARKQWPNVGLVRRAGEMLDDGGYLPDLLLAAMPGM